MLNFCCQMPSAKTTNSQHRTAKPDHQLHRATRQQHRGIMAPNNDPDDPYHHRDMSWGKVSDKAASTLPFVLEMLPARAHLYMQHRKGHWCWTDAEIKSLKHQAGVLHLEWPSIAKVSVLLSRPTCGISSQP